MLDAGLDSELMDWDGDGDGDGDENRVGVSAL